MTRKAICVVSIDDDVNSLPALTRRMSVFTWKKYAEKIGVDLIVVDKLPEDLEGLDPCYAKYDVYRNILRKYDQCLAVDSDILVTEDAPDFFEQISEDVDYAGLDHFTYECDSMKLVGNEIVDRLSKQGFNCEDWKTIGDRFLFFNGGVVFAKNTCLPIFKHISKEDAKITEHRWVEQNYTNLLLNTSKLKFQEIHKRFNFMDASIPYERRLNGWFIHYAGGGWGRFNGKSKYENMKRDFELLYPNDWIE